ncbi:MAG: LysR family transcriptional regulator [Bacilli bacterium]
MDVLLLTFVTIVERNNFTKAAEELHLSQSAVSREIQVLENKYGVKLFDRTNKYVRLTKAGEVLYHHAEVTDRVFSDVGLSPVSMMEFGSSQVIKESVEAGLGISIISEWTIRKEMKYGTLCALKIKNVPISRDVCYVLPNTQFRTRATDLFVERIPAMVKNLVLL